MSNHIDRVVKGGFGGGFEADAGQYISVIDLDGRQAGDFVALNRHDLSEGLSAVRSRRHLLSLYFRVGDQLLSSRDHPMLEVVADSIGIHRDVGHWSGGPSTPLGMRVHNWLG